VVAVIDDDPSVRGALRRLFRTAGLEVSLFANAEEYLSSPDRADLQCLVIDVRLPGMSGLELLEEARKENRPALLMTAHEDEQACRQALAAGAGGFFLKPFDNRQLLAAVLRALAISNP
jgi:FixJ family two-component response regulator